MLLTSTHTPHLLSLLGPGGTLLVSQHAPENRRAFIHPLGAPDGNGVLTEDTPSHHPWQHGLYVGLNDVNGFGFWTEGLKPKTAALDGTFHPAPLAPPEVAGSTAAWAVATEWRTPKNEPLLEEKQGWQIDAGNFESSYVLDFEWTIRAIAEVRFGQSHYGGLFLRMPFNKDTGGQVLTSEGVTLREQAEQQRARWVAVAMPIPGRGSESACGIAMMDHPANPEHPVPWRVDNQLGLAPSRCIAGAWVLRAGQTVRARHRLFVFLGPPDAACIDRMWKNFCQT